MAKKKLSRDQKRKQKKRKRNKSQIAGADPYQKMIHRLKKSGMDDYKFIQNPAGIDKMSAVLLDFIEPYQEFADTTDAMHKLIGVALVAWNTALLPEADQAASLQSVSSGLPANAVEDFNAIVEEMIARKNNHFAHYTRPILDYELTDLGHSYHVSVISPMDPNEVQKDE